MTIINASYWLRRIIHIALALIPIIYYWHADAISELIGLNSALIIYYIVILMLIFEIARLRFGWTLIAQRKYEAQQISALAWSTFAIATVLLAAPKIGTQGAAIGLPLIWSLSFADPIMGELRRLALSNWLVALIGLAAVVIIWGLAIIWLQTPWWLIFIIPPITIAAEWPQFTWIDDNALMLFLPLLVILLFKNWL